jgi:6-phosphofructokinase 1
MGRDSGYIAIQSGIGGGAEMVMVPETHSSLEEVIETLKEGWTRSKTSSIIIVAEGDEEGGANAVAGRVKQHIPHADIKVTLLGHVQRGGAPSAVDRILASRLGAAAVEGLISGKKNVMAGLINNEVVYTPFYDTITKSKPIHDDLIRLVEILSI